jgi:NADPH:quinone reductase-like Zn-dependent oxidoreductase
MRGFGFCAHGGDEALDWVDVAEPVPGPGEVRVRLRASAFNHLDRFVLKGIPGVPVELPHVLGSDGSGTVAEIGPDVEGLSVGQPVLVNPGLWDGTCEACRRGEEALCPAYRIVGEHTQGTATESLVVPARNLHPKPERLSFEEAAAVPLVFQTAWRAIRTVGALAPGETVAVVGAGGGVASAVIQVAKRGGARVVVLSRHAEKLERARALGADDGLVIPPDGAFDRLLWAWSGKRGVDLIFDPGGAATLPRSVRALARAGRVVVIGATTGPEVTLDLRTVFWRQASLRGSTMANRSEFEAVLGELAAGRLRPVLDSVHPLEEAPVAFRRFDAPDLFGKVVLRHP